MNPRELPIYAAESELIAALKVHQVVVVESPAGSGKTTQIPQMLYRAGLGEMGVIGVTQPRRIAAMSVSARIASEMGVGLGGVVGYKMRFEDITSPETRIKIMTDGILLQEMHHDPLLRDYALIMVDEAHERSLNIDFILGLLKRLLVQRRDLRVIVSSATLNAEAFSRYFDAPPRVFVDVAPHPVEVRHLRYELEWGPDVLVDETVDVVREGMELRPSGHALVFLPGEAAILKVAERLQALPGAGGWEIIPLFGRLSREEQERAFLAFPGRRKIVIATNIAETSITIDGVAVVVDSGLAKVNSFNHRTGIAALQEEPISQASCEQRRGRAGRTGPGLCLRLYTQASATERPAHPVEEILRVDLAEVVLRMLALRIRDVEDFAFLTSPDPGALQSALETLIELGAATESRELTGVGQRMAELPLGPRIGRMVVEAALNHPEALDAVYTIAAFLSARSPFAYASDGDLEQIRAAHRRFADDRGDFHTYLAVFRAYERASSKERFCARNHLDARVLGEVANIRGQLGDLVGVLPPEGGGKLDAGVLLRLVATGFPRLICRRTPRGGGYHSVSGRGIYLHPGSALFRRPPECFVATEVVRTKRAFARAAGIMEPAWVREVAPDVFTQLFGPTRHGKGEPTTREAPLREVQLAGRRFPIKRQRNQLLVSFPWEELAALPLPLPLPPELAERDVRAEIELDDGSLMRGERLESVLAAAPHLRAGEPTLQRWPRDDFYALPGSTGALLRHLPDLLRVVDTGGRRRTLGLLTLCTNGNGGFWYDASHAPGDAAATSLMALDALEGPLGEAHDEAGLAAVARARVELERVDAALS